MGGARFDEFVRDLVGGASRRGLLQSLGALPLAGALAGVVTDAEAKKSHNKNNGRGGGNGQNDNDDDDGVDADGNNKGKRRKQKRCQEKKSKACESRCGKVTVKCKRPKGKKAKKHRVNCGPCACEPGTCPNGQTCLNSVCVEACVCGAGCPFTSIQDAIDAVDPGTTINVCAGTFTENLNVDKVVTIVGAGEGADPTEDTILDGNAAGSVILNAAEGVTLRSLRIINGVAEDGAGINNQGTSLELENVTITENSATGSGGGIFNGSDLTLTVTNSTIFGNASAGNGGGIFNSLGGNVTLTDGFVSSNTTTVVSTDGGGVFNSGTLTITGTTFAENTASRDGGGVYNNAGTVDVTNGAFTANNSTTNSGAGLYNAGGSMTLSNTDVTGGEAGDAGGGIYNRAAGIIPGLLTLDSGASITGNFATNQGGGVFNTGADATVVCAGATITGNTADDPPVASNCIDANGGLGCNTCL